MERTETQMKILEVGKKEFLEKGFKDASLNKIVAEAGFTKGAFYGYYPDKAALFEDLVGEASKGLLEQFKAAQSAHLDLVSEEKTKDSLKLSTEYLRVFVEYMYAHFDAFKLILCRAEGTRYANFFGGACGTGGKVLRGILRTSPQKRKALWKNDKAASPHDYQRLFYCGM